ncbi:hypothetical protein MOUN0_I01574 [Monosporozyma unispora]
MIGESPSCIKFYQFPVKEIYHKVIALLYCSFFFAVSSNVIEGGNQNWFLPDASFSLSL